jgi:phosphatidylglycerol---prolipoprotein diacylglyceryl transferase
VIPYAPHPILFNIGPVAIRFYSLAYILAFVLIYYALKKRFGKERSEDLLTWIIVAVIVGGRLGEFIFYSPKTFWTDPLEILKIWHGGMSFHGGFIAVALVLWWYAKKHKMSFFAITDAGIIVGTFAIGVGRVANWLNGELVGTITNVPWCMQFPGYTGCRHPSQLYEAAYMFAIAGILLWQSRKKHQEGFISMLFIFLYGVFRFALNFFRDDPRWLGISTGQWLSLAMVLVAGYFLLTKYKKSVKRVFA